MSYSREYYQKTKEAHKERSRKWREANRERRKVYEKEYYERNKNKARQYDWEYQLRTRYNMTKEEYETILLSQNNCCAICKGKCTRKFAVDHDHDTGKIRGLLCNKCNRGLGLFLDNPSFLEEAASYLRTKGAKCLS